MDGYRSWTTKVRADEVYGCSPYFSAYEFLIPNLPAEHALGALVRKTTESAKTRSNVLQTT